LAEAVTVATTLPSELFRAAAPEPVSEPRLVARNADLASDLNLGPSWFESETTLAILSGNAPFPGQEPVALAYAGHQFGNFVPQLGDGRAHLIATRETSDGVFELQLKGSGPTPFSRNGDGRAALGPMLREYMISEAMAGLGIPTTRTLAVVSTGELVYRRRKEPGAIAARVARSHVRVGTFQYLAARQMTETILTLVDHELARSYKDYPKDGSRFLWLLQHATERQARLIAKWMCVGFIHGVMNTDNMAISGETIDYGPCAFMDAFHPKKVFSSIDEWGRYAWDQQPAIALWNLTRFAECLLPLLDEDVDKAVEIAKSGLSNFYSIFEVAFETGMMAKLGASDRQSEDGQFIAGLLKVMMDNKADFAQCFTELTRHAVLDSSVSIEAMSSWLPTWKARVPTPNVELMQRSNPVYIARNHQVEAALQEAEQGKMTRFNTLCQLLKTPFTEKPNMTLFEAPPLPEEEVTATFCGT
jgi:serine/tyrosine/threonine adenylyltransferase